MGLKSQPKLNRHSDERQEKILDQTTQGVRRSKSRTKTSLLFFLVSSICDSFMDVHP